MKVTLFYLALASILFNISLAVSIWKERKHASMSRAIGWFIFGGVIAIISVLSGIYTAIVMGTKQTLLQAKRIILES